LTALAQHLPRSITCAGHPPARLRAEAAKQEYKREAFELFASLLDRVRA